MDCQYSLLVNDTGISEILCNRPGSAYSTNPFVSLQYDCPMGKKYTGPIDPEDRREAECEARMNENEEAM